MNPSEHNEISRAISILDRSAVLDLVKDTGTPNFLLKKAERVVAALFLLTASFSDSEPLKWELRAAGTALIRGIPFFRSPTRASDTETVNESVRDAALTLTLLELACISGLLSPMNFSLLQKELEGILSSTEYKRAGERTVLPRSLFVDERRQATVNRPRSTEPTERKEASSETVPPAQISQGLIPDTTAGIKDIDKRHTGIKDSVLYRTQGEKALSESRGAAPKPTQATSTRQISRIVNDKIRTERVATIIALLRKKSGAAIKDFVSLIHGCSGKTIQRLLLDLISKNVLYRQGRKRWSRYYLSGTEPVPHSEAVPT